MATKPFKAGDLILMCKGGVKDLTKSEDEALREEASMSRDRRREETYAGVLGPGRDFSVIRSARKGCSQLLLGPARFVNHDCDPNAEFHRLGSSQMVFKCLRPIGLNEEITTYYGDNYFEWGNAECMCLTCEVRGKGAFSKPELAGGLAIDGDAVAGMETGVGPGTEPGGDRQAGMRRSSQRKKASSPSTPDPLHSHGSTNGSGHPTPTTAMVQRNGTTFEKTFEHSISDREFDDTTLVYQRGPRCTCLTCGSPFWAPESWWTPDECRRCERHYRIFKADWPGRMPTEGGWSKKAQSKRKIREELQLAAAGVNTPEDEDDYDKILHPAKRRQLKHAGAKFDRRKLGSPSVSSNSSSSLSETTVDSPVKLSPLRDTKPTNATGGGVASKKRPQPMVKSNKRIAHRDKATSGGGDGTDEDAVDASLNTVSTNAAKSKVAAISAAHLSARAPTSRHQPMAYSDDESDLTDMSDDDDNVSTPVVERRSRSASSDASSSSDDKPSGPKMLGKEAKTETLALFWGAPTGDRRNRRQSNNGLESLARNVKREGSHLRKGSGSSQKHRRTASDLSQTGSQSGARKTSSASSGGKLVQQSFDSPLRDDEVGSRSPRSSVKPSASLGRRLDEGSISPPGLSPAAQRSGDDRDPSGSGEDALVVIRQGAGEGWAGPSPGARNSPSTGNTLPPGLATQGPARTSVKNLAMAWGAGIEEGEGRTRRKVSSKDSSGAAKKAPGGNEETGRSMTPEVKAGKLPASPLRFAEDEERKEDLALSKSVHSQLQQQHHQIHQKSASPVGAASFSPLAGPPPTHFASRPGIAPGQPIRKNLRWGSGKVSSSRPMSLAGPGAGPGAKGSASDSNIPRSHAHASSPQPTSQPQPQPQSPLSVAHQHNNGGGNGRTAVVGGGNNEASLRSISGPVLPPARERLNSPLAKAAMTAANNGGSNRGASPCDWSLSKDRASPISAMGPPTAAATATVVARSSPFSPKRDSPPVTSPSSKSMQAVGKGSEAAPFAPPSPSAIAAPMSPSTKGAVKVEENN